MKGRAYSNSPRVYRPYTLLDALPFQFTKPPNFSLSTSGQLLGALCIMYHAPCVIDSHVTIATDRAYAFGLSFERFSTSRPNHQFRQSSLRPCCQRFIETSAPSAFFRTYAHLRSSKGLPLHVVTGRPGRASGVLCYNGDRALERTPSHQKRGGSRLSKGDNRENPLSGRLASRNTKGNQKEGREGYLRSCDDHRWWRRGAFLDAKRIRNHAIQRKIKR